MNADPCPFCTGSEVTPYVTAEARVVMRCEKLRRIRPDNRRSERVLWRLIGVDMRLMQLAAITVIVTLGSAAAYAGNPVPPNVKALVKAEAELNNLCRGGPGDDPKTLQACDDRNAVETRLYAVGWCYGMRGQAGYQMKGHKCTKNSLHQGD